MNEKQKLELNWPDNVSYDTTNWESTIIQNKVIAFVAFHYDHAINPCKEWDGFGQIRSLNTSHIDNISIEEIEELLADPINKEQMIPLSYFEHGNCIWGVRGTMDTMPDFNWDGVNFAGVWIPDEECIKTVNSLEKKYGHKKEFNRNYEFKKMAVQACETYTAFCNGEVYGFQTELYRLQFDGDHNPIEEHGNYEHLDQLFEDSCWGFFGNDIEHMKDTITDSVTHHLKTMKGDASNYDNMKNEDFDRILGVLVNRDSHTLLTIPGIYEVVSEHYNNEVLNEWSKEQLK